MIQSEIITIETLLVGSKIQIICIQLFLFSKPLLKHTDDIIIIYFYFYNYMF